MRECGMGCDGEEQLGLGFELSWAGVGRSREGGTKVRQVGGELVGGGRWVLCKLPCVPPSMKYRYYVLVLYFFIIRT